MRIYGIDFPDETFANLFQIEGWMYKNQEKLKKRGHVVLGKAFHMKQAIRLLYEEPDVIWNRWLDKHIEIYCNNDFATIWGPAASAKSNDFGLCALVEWYMDPHNTHIKICSTTKGELEKRIWESIVRHFKIWEGKMPGYISNRRMAILCSSADEDNDLAKAGIFGVAIMQGSEEDAKSNMIGVHLPYVRVILDEMQSCREVAVRARHNLSKGVSDFKFIGFGNPKSWMDTLGKYSFPVCGLGSISVDSEEWPTKYGMCYHFDGLKSPCYDYEDGEERFPFFVKPSEIDKQRKEDGEGTLDWWQMVRGYVPPTGISNCIVPESILFQGNAFDDDTFYSGYTQCLAIDPSKSADGDACVAQPFRVGINSSRKLIIKFQDPITINPPLSGSRPRIYCISDEVQKICTGLGIEKRYIGVDDSAMQSLADVLDNEMQGIQRVHRVRFGEAASTKFPYFGARKTGHEEYKTRVTELYYNIYHFARYGHIRMLPAKAADDITNRLAKEVVTGSSKKQAETKDEFRKRMGRSPDNGDAIAIAIDMCIFIFGCLAGTNSYSNMTNIDNMIRNAKMGNYKTYYADDSISSTGYADEGLK